MLVTTPTPQRHSAEGLVATGAAAVSAAAGAIHFAMAGRLGDDARLDGLGLAVAACFQIGWALAALARPGRALYLAGSAGNALILLGWAAARAAGWPQEAGAIGAAEAVAAVFGMGVVAACVALAGSKLRHRRIAAGRAGLATIALAAGIASVTLAALAVVPGRPGGSPSGPAAAAPEQFVSGPASEGSGGRRSRTHAVAVVDDRFEPVSLEIRPGDTVVWTNRGDAPHTASADAGEFESDNLDPGATYSHTFEVGGTFLYYCRYHGAPGGSGMSATIVVADNDGNRPPVIAAAGGPTSRGTGAPATHSVAVKDDSFAPQKLTVETGDTVAWTNEGGSMHTVTSDSGAFDSGDLSPRSRFSHTFDSPGVFYYYCRFHGSPGSGMWGAVVVTEDGGTAAALAADPPRSTGKVESGPVPKGSHEVVLSDDAFRPFEITIAAGDTVTWVNRNDRVHTATADDGRFRSGRLQPGDAFTFEFANTGTYTYYCEFHGKPKSGMWGKVIVTKDGSEGSAPPPPKDAGKDDRGDGDDCDNSGSGNCGDRDDDDDCDNSGPGNCDDDELAEAKARCREAKREARAEGDEEELEKARRKCRKWIADATE